MWRGNPGTRGPQKDTRRNRYSFCTCYSRAMERTEHGCYRRRAHDAPVVLSDRLCKLLCAAGTAPCAAASRPRRAATQLYLGTYLQSRSRIRAKATACACGLDTAGRRPILPAPALVPSRCRCLCKISIFLAMISMSGLPASRDLHARPLMTHPIRFSLATVGARRPS